VLFPFLSFPFHHLIPPKRRPTHQAVHVLGGLQELGYRCHGSRFGAGPLLFFLPSFLGLEGEVWAEASFEADQEALSIRLVSMLRLSARALSAHSLLAAPVKPAALHTRSTVAQQVAALPKDSPSSTSFIAPLPRSQAPSASTHQQVRTRSVGPDDRLFASCMGVC
jgi:hypothetical protein